MISLGVRFYKGFISKNYEVESALEAFKTELPLSHIPPLERRRLGEASKCIFGILGDMKIDCDIIFSSTKGEINRCYDMLTSLSSSSFISPTSFSLSVLNASSALLAIANANHNEILAISAKESLEYALMNAYINLADSSSLKDCLIISYFEGLESRDISLVVLRVALDSTLPQIRLKHKDSTLESSPSYASNLAFLKNIVAKKPSYTFSSSNLLWEWDIADLRGLE